MNSVGVGLPDASNVTMIAGGTSYIICDLLKKEEATIAGLKYSDWRILKPNEAYYQAYDKKGTIWEQDDLDDDEE